MKIIIVAHGVPTSEDPQWGCFELDQARALRDYGHQVTICAVDGRYRPKLHRKCGISHQNFEGIHAYSFYLFPLSFLLIDKLKILANDWMMSYLYRYVKKRHGEFDILYGHYGPVCGKLRLVRKHYPELPIVIIEHWGKFGYAELTAREQYTVKTSYKLADKMLAVSPFLKDYLHQHYNVEATVVFDMVGREFLDTPLFSRNRTPFGFVSVGSLIPRKAFDLLLKAFSELENQQCRLTIIGDGPELPSLKKQLVELNIQDRVAFVGKCNKQQIIEYLFSNNVFVLPSRHETFCVVNIEALATGMPVVSTRCGGPENFVNSSNGLLVDVDDKTSLVAAMNTIERNYEMYKPEEIREYIRGRFSGESIASQLDEIFKAVISDKKETKQKM